MKTKKLQQPLSWHLVSPVQMHKLRHRAQNQHQRIRQGVKSGELTKAEARNLGQRSKEIFTRDAKDGKIRRCITPKGERKLSAEEERKDSREIYRKKHKQG